MCVPWPLSLQTLTSPRCRSTSPRLALRSAEVLLTASFTNTLSLREHASRDGQTLKWSRLVSGARRDSASTVRGLTEVPQEPIIIVERTIVESRNARFRTCLIPQASTPSLPGFPQGAAFPPLSRAPSHQRYRPALRRSRRLSLPPQGRQRDSVRGH